MTSSIQDVETLDRKTDVTRVPLLYSWRLAVALICTIGAMVNMLSRLQTSFAVICMTQKQSSNDPIENTTSDGDFDILQGEFLWEKSFQGVVLSSYFYGYVAALVIGGWLADQHSSYRVIIGSVLGQAVCLVAIPEMTRQSSTSILVLRILQGIIATAVYPAFNVMIRNWSLDGEFPLLFSLLHSGAFLGGAAAFPISSALCQGSLFGGWPAIFYFTALMLVMWAALAGVLLRDSPKDHRFVSDAEKDCLAAQMNANGTPKLSRSLNIIWAILTNLQVWIISLSCFTTTWLFTSLNVTLPIFMEEGFHFNIHQNGLLSALPGVMLGCFSLLAGKSHHYLNVERGFSSTKACKILSLVGLLVPSTLMTLVLVLAASHRYLTVIFIALSQGFSAFMICAGPQTGIKEIAPQYIGVIWGVAASIANTTGFLGPLVAAAMTPGGTLEEWCGFFIISIALMLLMALLIGIGWKSEIQPFAKPVMPQDKNETVPSTPCSSECPK